MEDIIDIIVTETTNLITITSSGSDEVIDVNIIDNREDIVLNVTPTLVEININSLTGNFGVNWGQITGTLSNQTDLQTVLNAKADLVGGLVPSSQLPSFVDDVIEVATFAALPVTGEQGKIYVVLATNFIYRWSGSTYIEIKDSSAVWGAITGTLSSQTDLQNALNAKFDDPTGDATQYIDGTGALQTFPVLTSADKLILVVRNTSGATITKGTVVYINGASGNKPTIAKALATSDATSAQTLGLVQTNIANNSNGNVVLVGSVIDLDTSSFTEGQQLYLSGVTAGAYTATKTLAPTHLVYVGVIARAHPTQGVIEVKIQNGYELDEIHDVSITSVANNDGLFYELSTDLWKNKSIATVLGYTPANGANYLALAGGTMTGAIVGTTASFLMSGSGIGLGVTGSGTGDAIKITHSSGRAFTLNSSGSGFGILINNDTASTSAPFTIQKQGASVITFTDAGAGTFASSLTALSFIKSGGTSSQFLKADGSVDSSTYALDNTVVKLTGTQTVAGVKTFSNQPVFNDTIMQKNTASGTVLFGGYTTLWTTDSAFTALVGTATSTTIGFSLLYDTSGQRSYTMPTANGTLALTSQLSSYLPLSGGTLTGALSGTSATFTHLLTGTSALFTSNVTIRPSAGYNAYFQTSGTSVRINYLNDALSTNVGAAFRATDFSFQDGGGSPVLSLASTGAATFSSSVTAGGLIKTETYYNAGSGSAKLVGVGSAISGGFSSTDMLVYNTGGDLYLIGTGAAGMIVKGTSGNVGIGTTNPTVAAGMGLVINGGATSPRIALKNNASGDASTDGFQLVLTTENEVVLENRENASMRFLTNATEAMRITSGGNVGIGTTSPNTRLHTTGSLTVDDIIYLQRSSSSLYLPIANYWNGSGNPLSGTKGDILAIGNAGGDGLVFVNSNTERMRITSDGRLLVSTTVTNPGQNNTDTGNALVGGRFFFNNGGSDNIIGRNSDGTLISWRRAGVEVGTIGVTSSATYYNTSSDYRLKQDLKSFDGLNLVNQINAYDYEWKSDNTRSFGVLAHELADVLPYAVQGVKDGEQMQSVDYSKIVPVLIQAIKELKSKIETLKNK